MNNETEELPNEFWTLASEGEKGLYVLGNTTAVVYAYTLAVVRISDIVIDVYNTLVFNQSETLILIYGVIIPCIHEIMSMESKWPQLLVEPHEKWIA